MNEPVSLRPVQEPPSQTVMTALLELYKDSPRFFEDLAKMMSRAHRPAFGSVTINFRESKIFMLEKKETKQ